MVQCVYEILDPSEREKALSAVGMYWMRINKEKNLDTKAARKARLMAKATVEARFGEVVAEGGQMSAAEVHVAKVLAAGNPPSGPAQQALARATAAPSAGGHALVHGGYGRHTAAIIATMQRMDANQQQTAAVLGGLVGAVGDLQLNHDRLQGEHDGRRADHAM